MASIEFITKRMEGKKAEIAKIEKKIARIEKAKATNWEVNPYYYHEDDLKWANKDLTAAREALAKYEEEYAHAVEKANSRNVKPILDFLEMWKQKVTNQYETGIREYYETRKALREMYAELDKLHYGSPEWKEAEAEYRAAEKAFHGKTCGYYKREKYINRWGREEEKSIKIRDGELEYISPYHRDQTYEAAMKHLAVDLKKDAEAKYDDIVERANAIVGTITDATGLSVGAKGELNGIVIGDRGRARIETIGAGGYNIQCFHFRTLIHEIK